MNAKTAAADTWHPSSERTSLPHDERIRDVQQGSDGLLYVLTDESRGRLLKLAPRKR